MLRRVWVGLGMLVVPGVVLTAAVTGAVAHLAFGLSWTAALLMGAVLSPTDPAILIPLFVRSRLRPKVAQTVVAESAFNDPTGAVLALAFAGVLISGDGSLAEPVGGLRRSTSRSAPCSAIVAGVLLAATISSHRTGIWRESAAAAVLMVVTISYFSLDSAGRQRLPRRLPRRADRRQHGAASGWRCTPCTSARCASSPSTSADLVTFFVFLVLGANIPFDELGENLLPALAVIAALLLLARPLTVLACTLPDRRGELDPAGAAPSSAGRGRRAWCRRRWSGVLAGLGVPEHRRSTRASSPWRSS